MSGLNALQERFAAAADAREGEAIYNAPLSAYCSFKIGGPAEILYIPHTEDALVFALRFAREAGAPCRVLGNGSNVLIDDKGLPGLTLRLAGGLTELYLREDGAVYCGAGVSLKRLCTFALDNGLAGLEFAYGIPGSVGGAVYMNAGAYGGEIKNVLESVRCIDPATLEKRERAAAGLDIAYRSTPFMTNGEIITGAAFRLAPGDPAVSKARMNELMAKRKASQPLEWPSAGSTFKRPKEGYAAAMIDQTGLKGYRVGGAEVSEKHAGFVINKNNATFADVCGVIEGVRQAVYEKFGVRLETEVEILGEL
jgi:UDP-N-acetylmuramate dehydrogenase